MLETTNIALIGSTGSIGQQTLEVVRALPERFRVIGLAAGQNIDLLQRQIGEYNPACYSHNGVGHQLDTNHKAKHISPEQIAAHPLADIVVIAVSGTAGLKTTIAAVRAGKRIALANKESLVMAGNIITAEAKKTGAQIMPVDSEHSAIWQCLNGEAQPAERLILTASGGPFLHYSQAQLQNVTPAQALNHPSWKMGKKITIDSATLMNKGLEVIEAHWLFNMPFEKISVLIHPQSLIHSMAEFADGSTKAQLSQPDMRLPIQYALTYPERLANTELPKLNWTKIPGFTFEQPDTEAFPCLRIAIEAGKMGGIYPAALCGADEAAVDLFLAGRIRFTDVPLLIEKILSEIKSPTTTPALEEIIEAERLARERVFQLTGE